MVANRRLHIAIAEPSPIVRLGLTSLLHRFSDLSLDIAEITTFNDLASQISRIAPDLLFVNASLLGLYSLPQFRSECGVESLKIVALQSALAESSALQSYDGVVSIYDSAQHVKELIKQIAVRPEPSEEKRELSAREKEIIVCIVKGMTNKIIADELSLSTHTVISHRRNIAAKLQIHSSSGLTIYAIVNKLVNLSDIKTTIE